MGTLLLIHRDKNLGVHIQSTTLKSVINCSKQKKNHWIENHLLSLILINVKVKVAQSCPTLCNPRNCSLPGSCVRGILQVRILEWAAIPFSRGSSPPQDPTHVSYTIGRYFFFFFFTTETPGKPDSDKVAIKTQTFLENDSLEVTISLYAWW